jgi:hypothetical protein
MQNIIWEGSNGLWQKALQNPDNAQIQWVIANPTSGSDDLVAQALHLQSQAFLSRYTLVLKESNGLSLYLRKGLPPLPVRSVPAYIWGELATQGEYCGTGVYPG